MDVFYLDHLNINRSNLEISLENNILQGIGEAEAERSQIRFWWQKERFKVEHEIQRERHKQLPNSKK